MIENWKPCQKIGILQNKGKSESENMIFQNAGKLARQDRKNQF